MDKKRIEYVDIFRGIGIILMILGHIGYIGIFDKIIRHVGFNVSADIVVHAFHMPMFFVVSGFFYSRPVKLCGGGYIKKKARTLLVPYIVFGIISYIIWLAINPESYSLAPLKHLLFENTDGLPITGALWFLTALFIVQVLYAVLDSCIKSRVVLTIFVIAISIFGCLAKRFIPYRLPYAFDTACGSMGLVHLGRVLYPHISREKNGKKQLLDIPWILVFVFSIISLILIGINGMVNLRVAEYSNLALYWINAIFSSYILLVISYKMSLMGNPFAKIINNCLINIGKDSIVYVCLNQIVIYYINIFLSRTIAYGYIYRCVLMALVMISLDLLRRILVNTQLRVLIGKSKNRK